MEYLTRKLGKAGAWLLIAVVVLALLIALYAAVGRYFTGDLKTEVKVGAAQTGAAIESGKQAVNTIGNRQEAEQAGAANVEESTHEIDNATDPGSVTAAGLNGLHRVRGQAGDRRRR
jgi:uncharacterized protein (UPF0333 family)